MKCDYMLPRAEHPLVAWEEPLPSCLLEEGHEDYHLILTSSGWYLFYPYTESCGDDCECAQDTDCTNYECFTWCKISNAEAQQLLNPLKAKKPKRSP